MRAIIVFCILNVLIFCLSVECGRLGNQKFSNKTDNYQLLQKNNFAQVDKLEQIKKDSKKNVNSQTNSTEPNKPCPAKCTCSDGLVDCVKAGFSEIPSANELPANTKIIDLKYNRIKRLAKFDHLPKLSKLIIRHNLLEEIEPEVFESAPNLKFLDLSFNENIILPNSLLKPLEHLEVFQCEFCNLTKFDEKFFENQRFLTHLYLDSNPLEKIGKLFFKDLSKLEFLDLTNTKLSEINISSEYPLEHLKTLNLSSNKLEYVPFFRNAPNIETLILDDNKIYVLNKESFLYLKNLKTLEISNNNELMDIEELTFTQQTKLKRLVISNNNHLFIISQHAFYGAFNESSFALKELILSKNSFHLMPEKLLQDHWGNLDVLDLRMNPWDCNCHLSWLKKYENISYVKELRCKSPDNLVTKYLVKLESKDMVCVKLIDSLLYDKLKAIIQGFVFILAFLVFTLAFVLLYVVQNRQNGWIRMFGTSSSPSSSTIYYTKANTNDLIKENPHLI